MRRLLTLPALLAPVVLAACLEPDPVPEANYGVIALDAIVTSTDTVLAPEAIFYRSRLATIPTSRISDNACQIATFPSEGTAITPPRFLDAGDSVAVSTDATTLFLFPTADANREFYALQDGQTLPFTPGELVTITVPGAPGGYANGTISTPTVRGFTLDTVASAPPADSGLTLRWTPAGDDSTKMLVQLTYGINQPDPNQQIFCELVDDGEFTIPTFLVTQWRTATTGSRAVVAARWRVAARQVNDGVLVVISAFEHEGVVD